MDIPNHPKVKPLTAKIARSIGLEQSFVDFVFATERPRCFRYRCEDAQRAWTCYIPDSADVAYPLWSTNGDQTLVLVTNRELSFGKGWHDNNDIEMLSKTSQGLLAHLMNAVLESEVSDEELHFAATACGFRYLDKLLSFRDSDFPDGMSWDEAFDQFIAEIDSAERA